MTLSISDSTIVQVALPVHLPTLFDYHCPLAVAVGNRVLVPFRRKQLVGIVVHIREKSTITPAKLRSVNKVLPTSLPTEIITLCQWVARYYHAPIGEVFQLALPKLLRQHKTLPTLQPATCYQATGLAQTVKAQLKNAPKQWALWHCIAEEPAGLHTIPSDLRNFLKPLQAKGLVDEKPVSHPTPTPPAHRLNPEQQLVVDAFAFGKFACHVLYGITGSGKTEVYLQLIAQVLATGKQALVLIPEISLTPQTTARFQAWFGEVVSVQHSKRSDTDRFSSWQTGLKGEAKIIIGTRSAIFQPFKNLGLIVVDEAHDLSFKQQDGVRYHARDLAVVRAKQLDIPVILGSATPALENIHLAEKGKYHWHQLTQRATGADPAPCVIDDLNQNTNALALSDFSLTQLRQTLGQGLQALVFINRRGFSPALHCLACGHTEACPQCDTKLTVHKHPPHLLCHHCGTSKPLKHQCPACGAQQQIMLGAGTEKIEQQLQQQFPSHQVLRIDRDTTGKKQDWQKIYQQVQDGTADILVGTQMLAKGHHFPKVALVIIVDVDQSLLSADFRATEYLGQLITQVTGRAGRAEHPGTAILQTHYPEHPVLHTTLHKGYLALANTILVERKAAELPPFSHLALLRAESAQPTLAQDFLNQAKACLPASDVLVLGPLPAPMEKRAGKYRFLLVLQSADKKALQQVLRHWVNTLYHIKTKPSLRWHLDVDPAQLH